MELSLAEISTIINEIESPENKLRKQQEFKSFQIYDGNLKPYVQARIREMYPKTWEAYTISDYSLLKKITDKKAKSYKQNPIRVAETSEDSKAYAEITAANGLSHTMIKLDRYYNQHKYALVGCLMTLNETVKPSKPGFNFMALAPYEFDCVKDASGKPRVVILSYPDSTILVGNTGDGQDTIIAGPKADEGRNKKVYAFWTDSNHYLIRVTFNDNGEPSGAPEMLPIPSNPNNVNPWGILPFAYVPLSDTPNYPNPSPLPDQAVELNALLSVYLTSGNMQVGQLVVKYPQGQDIQMVTHGLMTGLKLPQSSDPDAAETDAYYLSPSPNMDGHRTSIMTFMNLILDEQGIKPASGTDISVEKFSSGLDRMISESDVQDVIEMNQMVYENVEKRLYDIVRAQLNSINDQTLSSDDIRVIYQKPKMLITDTERLTNLEKMIDLGLLEPWEKFVFVDPNMTEEQAKEKLGRIDHGERSRAEEMARAVGFGGDQEPAQDEAVDADNS